MNPAADHELPHWVLFPGLHGTADLFERFLAAAPPAASMRLVTYPTDQCLNWAALHRHVAAQLHEQGNLVLVAESFGGPLALQFAADHPQAVRVVVLCASFVRPPVPRILCYLATPLVWCAFPVPGFAIRVFLSGLRSPRALVGQVRLAIRSNSPRALAQRVRMAAWTDACAALAGCRAPILYLAARRDRLVGARSLRHIRKIRPDIQVQTMDTPHLLLQTRPREAWRHIQQFLGGHPKV